MDTPEGRGIITDINLLREMVKVRLDKESETDLVIFRADEIKVVQKKKVSSSSKQNIEVDDETILED